MKDGTRVSLIYTLALIPSILSLIWVFSFIDIYYYLSDLTLPLMALFTSIVFAILFSYFEPHLIHWRKAYSEFEDNYRYEEEVE